ncbi:MAG: DUF167 domain-containing protein [Promethearchaeota archaeon]
MIKNPHKDSNNSVLLNIFVKPNSKKQKISYDGEFLLISLVSKAIQNKANKELIKLLKNKLNISANQIRIISGLKKSNKKIKIDFLKNINKKDVLKKLLS